MLPVFIHNSINFTRIPLSTTSKNDHHLEELTISIAIELLITNLYIPRPVPGRGVRHRFTSAGRLQCSPFTTDTRGKQLADSVSISSVAVLNTDSSSKFPGNADPRYPDVSLALITSSEWQTHATTSSDHLPILIGLQTTAITSHARHRTYINIKKADWTGYNQEIERKMGETSSSN